LRLIETLRGRALERAFWDYFKPAFKGTAAAFPFSVSLTLYETLSQFASPFSQVYITSLTGIIQKIPQKVQRSIFRNCVPGRFTKQAVAQLPIQPTRIGTTAASTQDFSDNDVTGVGLDAGPGLAPVLVIENSEQF
jgi:hypothetical protein